MKRFLSAILAALLPSLAPHSVKADVIDVLWTGDMFSDYSVASNWSPQVVPNNGNGGNNYRVTIDGSGPSLDIDATVDALTLKAGGRLTVRNHTFSATSTRNDTAAPELIYGRLIGTPAGGVSVGGYAPAKADLGLLANYNSSTNTLESGVYSVFAFEGGPPGELTFKGARIATNAANIFLGGGRITDEFGNDALQQLAVNDGVLNLSQTSFQTGGDFTNNGELDLVPDRTGDTVFVITGKLTNFDPNTKTLTGGRYVVYDPTYHGYKTLLQFRGADIVTNAADIIVARMQDDVSATGQPSIVDENGLDALRNFANNTARGRITFLDPDFTTAAARVTNAGYMFVGRRYSLPKGGVFEQTDGELLVSTGPGAALDTEGGSILIHGGQITGGGRLIGTITNNGVIAPAALMTFVGDLTLGSSSVLRLDLGGKGRGTVPSTRGFPRVYGYDAIDSNGVTAIDGRLQVNLSSVGPENGSRFTPASNDTFVLLKSQAPIVGSFRNIANGQRLRTTEGGGSFLVSYGPNAPDPTAVVLSDFQPNTGPAGLLNISTRGLVGSGERALIGGFIITGSEPKPVILRAIGPSLRKHLVAAPLDDPTLRLHDHNGATIASNDDWQQSPQWTEIQASGIPPSDAREGAIVTTLAPGAFTAVLEGKNGATGVGLVEIYDLDAGTQSQLANISTRGYAESGDNALIGGIIIGGGSGSTDILVRALGPSLSKSGVMATLENPNLSLRNQQMELYGNDDWRQSPQQADIQATGISPSDDRESALIWSLAPGAYTAVVAPSLATGTPSGVGLVEFYRLR